MMYDTLNAFIERIRLALRSKSKEIRISSVEAEDISLTIAQMLANESNHLQEIKDLQKQIIDLQTKVGNMDNLVIKMTGGTFK